VSIRHRNRLAIPNDHKDDAQIAASPEHSRLRREPDRHLCRRMTMTKSIALLMSLAMIGSACGSSNSAVVDTAGEPSATTTAASQSGGPVAAGVDRAAASASAPVDEWVNGINDAGWDFHRHLDGNAVSSPVSIGVAFSLARAGASTDTAAALDEIFAFPTKGRDAAANSASLMLADASVGPTTLEVANRLFPDVNFSPLPAFVDTAAAHYGATVETVDMSDGPAAAEVINNWVAETTRGLIPTIVDGGAIQDQRLALVNTVYLKADWAEPFLPELTNAGVFTTSDASTVTTSFMRDRIPITRRFVRLADADAVELPYEGGDLAMWIVVPRETDGLPGVEASLDAASLANLSEVAETGMVDITLPKWEQTLPPSDLFGWLCPLGFCARAGFDNIAPGLFITSALHGAKVIVDEKGTEAAAVTAMTFRVSGPPPADLTVVADHPFLWAIIHRQTGALVFVGRLVDPAA